MKEEKVMGLIETKAAPAMEAARERYQRVLRDYGDCPLTREGLSWSKI